MNTMGQHSGVVACPEVLQWRDIFSNATHKVLGSIDVHCNMAPYLLFVDK